mmetsp:Transcript_17730/g.35596  ORF Transcript_17730/g.35596 Transcript_17730/m.35596 type:complete len:271 (-) Transcript_17730:491-1303(-)
MQAHGTGGQRWHTQLCTSCCLCVHRANTVCAVCTPCVHTEQIPRGNTVCQRVHGGYLVGGRLVHSEGGDQRGQHKEGGESEGNGRRHGSRRGSLRLGNGGGHRALALNRLLVHLARHAGGGIDHGVHWQRRSKGFELDIEASPARTSLDSCQYLLGLVSGFDVGGKHQLAAASLVLDIGELDKVRRQIECQAHVRRYHPHVVFHLGLEPTVLKVWHTDVEHDRPRTVAGCEGDATLVFGKRVQILVAFRDLGSTASPRVLRRLQRSLARV